MKQSLQGIACSQVFCFKICGISYEGFMIRRATKSDVQGINNLLRQVLMVHYEGRPDLWRKDAKKYTDDELLEIIEDDSRPIFVSVNDAQEVEGYAFCVYEIYNGDNVRSDLKTLYIDDLCVDEKKRKNHIGTALYNYVIDFARKNSFYNVTLNVWESNKSARAFYDAMGLVPLKTCLEKVL